MSIQQIISKIEGRLTWAVHKKYIYSGDEEISSDPWSRSHTIIIPEKDHRDIEYLHELAHAHLAERHHLLSTAVFAQGTAESAYDQLVCPIRMASDWFADALLMQWAPAEEAREIQEHIEYTRWQAAIDDADLYILYGGGLLWAQGIYYLGYKLSDVPDAFIPAVKLFLQTDPGNPSVEAKRDLINSLAALTCLLRVEIAHEDGFDVWKIRKEQQNG